MNTQDWRSSVVADEGTHHLVGGKPLYSARFEQVLKYHEPGLAPVQDASGAYHIDSGGTPAYADRYLRTFGFYEGIAAVAGDSGWFHIHPSGTRLYTESYTWCGNFQSQRCPVRDNTGLYFHVQIDGRAAYTERYQYAGDFRDGTAVVQGPHGKHTHIDRDGNLIHSIWFDDLDIFHKGFARACDQLGWHHITPDGRPAYARRFAAIEPFYNGQARVETFDGGLEVVDEQGATILVLRAEDDMVFHRVSADLVGYWKTQAIATAVRLGAFDQTRFSTESFAHRAMLPIESANRLLRAVGELRLVERVEPDQWHVTNRGTFLSPSHPTTLAEAALEYAGPLATAWSELSAFLTGASPISDTVFSEVAKNPVRKFSHHRMLQSYARHDYPPIAAHIPVAPGGQIIDAGGGTGTLAMLLLELHPSATATVLDLPGIVDQVPCDKYPQRLSAIAAEIFEQWPIVGDTILLARVLHDWEDADAVRILRNARAALQPNGVVAILEMVTEPHSFAGSLCDLHLLSVSGGCERSTDQFANLLERAGLRLLETRQVGRIPQILLAVAA